MESSGLVKRMTDAYLEAGGSEDVIDESIANEVFWDFAAAEPVAMARFRDVETMTAITGESGTQAFLARWMGSLRGRARPESFQPASILSVRHASRPSGDD